jgi:hypothetical protein
MEDGGLYSMYDNKRMGLQTGSLLDMVMVFTVLQKV